MVKPS